MCAVTPTDFENTDEDFADTYVGVGIVAMT
jgi:hypothetical protein